MPNEDAELALLWELYRCCGKLKTSELVKCAKRHFPVILTPVELSRKTPNDRPWWDGRFRFNLSILGKKDEARNVNRGSWCITQKGIERLRGAGYEVGEKPLSSKIQSEGQMVTESNLTNKLMELWTANLRGTKAEMCAQISERIFGLLSLCKFDETKLIFDQLWDLIDFDELCRMNGNMGVTGFWGKDTLLEPF